MRTQLFFSGMTGGLLASAALGMAFSTVTHAATKIYGTPTTSVEAARYYGFQSWATDTDSRAITYSIKNKPSWATFDTRYGHLYGTPTSSSAGTYGGIVITASDGVSTASLPAFSITVERTGSSSSASSSSGSSSSGGSSGNGDSSSGTTTGSATVNWHPPTENTNGTTITNLSGYTIKYGTNKSDLTSSVKVANPGLTSYVIENLAAGTYYFGVLAYNSTGATSAVSSIVSKTVK